MKILRIIRMLNANFLLEFNNLLLGCFFVKKYSKVDNFISFRAYVSIYR